MIEPVVEATPVGAVSSPSPGGSHARYLEPVDEELDTLELTVEGELPTALDGSYVRNGPERPVRRDRRGGSTRSTATG